MGDRAGRKAMQERRRALSEARGVVGTRFMGARKELTAQVREMVAVAADTVREEMSEPSFVREFCATLKYGASKAVMDRTCINATLQILKLVGEERRITVEFIHSLGASSEEQLKGYVEAAKSVEGASLHDSAERCIAFLEAYFNANPQMRRAGIKRLGGQLPEAEVVSG